VVFKNATYGTQMQNLSQSFRKKSIDDIYGEGLQKRQK
jgi:hypothetical protein